MSTNVSSPVGDLGVAPWKVIGFLQDELDVSVAKGYIDADTAEERKKDFRNALANARPENPEHWRGREFIGELPTAVCYPTVFGQLRIECTAPGVYGMRVDDSHDNRPASCVSEREAPAGTEAPTLNAHS